MPSRPVDTQSVKHSCTQASSKNLFVFKTQENNANAAVKALKKLQVQTNEINQEFRKTSPLEGFVRDLKSLYQLLDSQKNVYPSWLVYSIAHETNLMLEKLISSYSKYNDAETFQKEAQNVLLNYQSSIDKLFVTVKGRLKNKDNTTDRLICSIIGSLVGAVIGGLFGPVGAICGIGIGSFISLKAVSFFSHRHSKEIGKINSHLTTNISDITGSLKNWIDKVEDEDLSVELIAN